jgi:hypothetical protein
MDTSSIPKKARVALPIYYSKMPFKAIPSILSDLKLRKKGSTVIMNLLGLIQFQVNRKRAGAMPPNMPGSMSLPLSTTWLLLRPREKLM